MVLFLSKQNKTKNYKEKILHTNIQQVIPRSSGYILCVHG